MRPRSSARARHGSGGFTRRDVAACSRFITAPSMGKMRESQWEVAHRCVCGWIELLGEEAEVVGRAADAREELLRIVGSTHLRKHIDQPEGTDQECTLILSEFRLHADVSIHNPPCMSCVLTTSTVEAPSLSR